MAPNDSFIICSTPQSQSRLSRGYLFPREAIERLHQEHRPPAGRHCSPSLDDRAAWLLNQSLHNAFPDANARTWILWHDREQPDRMASARTERADCAGDYRIVVQRTEALCGHYVHGSWDAALQNPLYAFRSIDRRFTFEEYMAGIDLMIGLEESSGGIDAMAGHLDFCGFDCSYAASDHPACG